jgi:hypothetical protein
MTAKVFYVLALVAILITGCRLENRDHAKRSDEALDEILRKSQQDLEQYVEELKNSHYRGGQPGKITVRGVIVKKVEDQMVLDERIQVEQTGGKGNRGVSQTIVSAANKATLSDSADLKQLENSIVSNEYINLGCENLSTEEIGDLEERTNAAITSTVLIYSAKKVFICGAQKISQFTVNISADQLILRNATIQAQSSWGSFSVSSVNLVLEGTNSIETLGVESPIKVLGAPTLNFTTVAEISGEGTLKLSSIGGNCIQNDEKK